MQIKEKWYDTEDLPCPICDSRRIAFHSIELSGDFEIFPSDLTINEVRYSRRGDDGKPKVEVDAAWPTMIYPLPGATKEGIGMNTCTNGRTAAA